MSNPSESFATPRVAAGVLYRDPEGRILLVKPTYKDGWELPGGYVEIGESPRAAAIREVRDELGIDWPVGELLDSIGRRTPTKATSCLSSSGVRHLRASSCRPPCLRSQSLVRHGSSSLRTRR